MPPCSPSSLVLSCYSLTTIPFRRGRMSARSDSFQDSSSKVSKKATLKAQARMALEEEHERTDGELKSNWPKAVDLYGSNLPCRLEGEVGDLVVLGKIPKEIDGTFYRMMVDPWCPPVEGNIPLDGDGNISAFRFHDGRVDMKTKYVETERYKLERRAGKALFGLYRNPWTHHPCVRAAIDSTANTNLVYWANHLLAMKESALPYSVDPQTLETRTYDPFGQIKAKTFTAHPKYDPYTDELIVHGYEAKGMATNDIVSYGIDRTGKCKNELWFKQPWINPGAIHDCAITKNWLILFIWPFEADVERMKKGGHHWAWNYDRGHTMIVAPRYPDNPPAPGWKKGETRHYTWKNCMAIHTAGAWEDASNPSLLYIESSRVHDNAFPFFPSDDGRLPAADAKADFVRWCIDTSTPAGTYISDPEVILDIPAEFPRIDERFMTQKYNLLWLNVFINPDGHKNIYHGLNGLAMHNHSTGKTQYHYAGDDSMCQEPIFVPRSEDAEEGDGYVMALIERVKANRCDVVVIDTREFEKAVAIVQLPFHMKAQVHGNWVSAKELGGYRSLVREVGEFEMRREGALEPL
ncbi:Lignostilbene-alpha,beta-dioxygenase isozyme I [Fulvia fulva]|nr:Lignostilbene-alpha,beta-dioxygenase isozyme I [Fulvia fulva]KAK4621048.1 Lignostilbene-alpha,beta-dioxygenase isozyme I [Fulvia fulva]WPV17726.1 Lignostilbene-alpha,beta-dioxygenase isozyme I [Fulvia fulva]WPV32546.1 Lignostilbene-alpha,beta-dioxygenase isozyme I [Fulvia fulva]